MTRSGKSYRTPGVTLFQLKVAVFVSTYSESNKTAAPVATALWAVPGGARTPVRADFLTRTRRAEDCPPYQVERRTAPWLQHACRAA